MANPWSDAANKRRLQLEQLEAQTKFLKKQSELMDRQAELEDFNLQKVQLEHESRQKALAALQDLSQPSSAPQGGIEGPPQQPAAGMTLQQILADPEGQFAALRSGLVEPKDIGMQEQRDMVMSLAGLGQPTQGMAGVQQGTQRVQQGGTPLGIDPLSALSGDPSRLKRHPLDEPLSPTEQQKYKPDAQGNYPQTLREAQSYQLLAPGEDRAITSQESGKIASIQKAKDNIQKAIGLMMPGGQIDKSIVAGMGFGDLSVGKSREINQLLGEAISTKVLVQSGVTARQDEIDAVRRQFVPSLLDLTNPGLVQRKLEGFQSFMDGTLDLTTLPPSLAERIKAKGFKAEKKKTELKAKGLGNLPQGVSQAEWDVMTPEERALFQ